MAGRPPSRGLRPSFLVIIPLSPPSQSDSPACRADAPVLDRAPLQTVFRPPLRRLPLISLTMKTLEDERPTRRDGGVLTLSL